ncbi:MAG: phosphatase PAP2 family protein [Actinobacteria bacterium]|nr:MAG: phosphatase PAP2 family protein [Actinomycetota bacterium]
MAAEPARPSGPRRWRTGVLLLLSLILAVPVFRALYQALDLFGLPGALGILLVVAAVLAVAWTVHLVRTYGGSLAPFARSIAGSLREAFASNPYLARAGRPLAGPWGLVRRRLSRRSSTGLFLTTGLALTLLLLLAFASITAQIVHHGALAQADVRLENLSDLLHHGEPVRLGTFFSSLGGATFRIPVSILIFGILWVPRPTPRALVGMAVALVLGPLASDIGRIVVKRPRPLVGATALPGSFSFPSGHAAGAAAAFAFLAYLGIRATSRLRTHIAIALLAGIAILGVGYSRVVLGFHWTSDVLAGTVLGLVVAVAAATWVGLREGPPLFHVPRPRTIQVSLSMTVAALVTIAAFHAWTNPRHAPALLPLPPTRLAALQIEPSILPRFSLHSETLTGRSMEPVGLILVGTKTQIEATFAAAGWSLADPVDLHTLLRVYSAGLRNRPYPSAPVTPAFLGGRTQDLAFEKAVVAGSIRERHHIRIWSSGFTLADGSPIWLATAPNHHIAPDIDTERDFIAAALSATGLARQVTQLQVVPPELGTNAAGDPFFTYGKADVIDLRVESAPG